MNQNGKVIITADGTCDLPKELIAEYNVHIIPLYVTLDDKSYRDGIDITMDDIFETYKEKKILPKTAAVAMGEYGDIFEKYVNDGFEVVHIALSSELSASCRNAQLAAEDLEGVEVVDSRHLSTGFGLLVLKAAKLAQEGFSAKEIAEKISPLTSKVDTSFVLNTLEFMHKGGRCSSVAALGANLLKLKPTIEMPAGSLVVGKKYRGNLKAVLQQYVQDKLEGRTDIDPDCMFVTHTTMDDDEIVPMVKEEIRKYIKMDKIYESTASCTISSHCGPNTLGILFMTK